MALLSDHCIYTILHTEKLFEAARLGGPAVFLESRAWVTGRRLWKQAQESGNGFPVLLGDATDCSRLKYWGLLTSVEIEDEGTRFTVDRVRPLQDLHTPQELVLRSSGKQIAPDFIRPYAICQTPSFLKDKDFQ